MCEFDDDDFDECPFCGEVLDDDGTCPNCDYDDEEE